MSIKKVLKILGYIFVPLLPMVIAIYFLFPYINEEKHQEVAEKHSEEFVIGDSTNVMTSNFRPAAEESETVGDLGKDYATMKENIEDLKMEIDSLTVVNDSLSQQLDQRESIAEEVEAADAEISEEEFSENIKSLLDLDIESLSPILNKMSDEQLVKIFKAGSGLQRKKLLQSLESDRAAKLMTEVL
ncbi:hypothetical protein CK503_07455 [Aliifodinibius salipaludis]|uniref:Magnesium transporter MgtE intracellular domain-containing protein n=1 Tax=Fodinibius salipaludis TaxID=2032627 RepID=A0A2A2GCW3_9BACT|nr:hypothetical protein [Aliifodinibius salipaludis]PAU94622.1 hypothetical protein CK503_07455 [Aliifodinibius salipaludis]